MKLAKSTILYIFILVAIIQFAIPAKMVFDSEMVIRDGKEFKFKVAPVDPNDPFRGKYITLNFEETEYTNYYNSFVGDDIYVRIQDNDNGFAEIADVVSYEPELPNHYIKTKVTYVYGSKIGFNYPSR